MGVIKKVGDGVKRLCAVLVACVVMWYSVITAPVFRVHGSFSDDFEILGGTFIGSLIGLATSTAFSPVVGAALGLALPLVVSASLRADDPGIAAPVQLPKSLPSTTFYGDYLVNDNDGDGSLSTRQICLYSYSWDYTGLDTSYGVVADTIVSCEDYQIGISAVPSSDWLSSSSRQNMSIQIACSSSYNNAEMIITPSYSASDSTGVTPVVDFTFWVTFPDGSGFHRTLVCSGASFSRVRFRILTHNSGSYIFDRSNFETYFNNTIGSGTPLGTVLFNLGYTMRWSNQSIIDSSSYPSLSAPITSNDDAVNYYDTSIRPYVVNNYSSTYPEVTEQFITYQEYYESIEPTPSETTFPGTGIIIIDPFTLPPEWVQSDVVELETDHYTVPFESMVADPFDYLVSPYTQTSTETVRGATKSVPISPPTPQYQVFPSSGNVQETAVGFVNLAYTLLNRSGLDYVIGIAVFGLCVSLLVL